MATDNNSSACINQSSTHSSSAIDSVATKLVIISYNLHGLNQGKNGIDELISTVEPDFIMLQELWLTSRQTICTNLASYQVNIVFLGLLLWAIVLVLAH